VDEIGEWGQEAEGKPFPYQELREGVLVWHSTCTRRGQSESLEPEREEQNTAMTARQKELRKRSQGCNR
jgi:hypothetical protein